MAAFRRLFLSEKGQGLIGRELGTIRIDVNAKNCFLTVVAVRVTVWIELANKM